MFPIERLLLGVSFADTIDARNMHSAVNRYAPLSESWYA